MEAESLTKYESAVESILSRHEANVPGFNSKGPALVQDYMYLGDFGDANSYGLLSELGVTYLLNCAGVYTGNRLMGSLGGGSGIRRYYQLEAHDNEKYDMTTHFNEAKEFIDEARYNNGKVLVYCARGVNRSAAICVAYLMAKDAMDLQTAVSTVAISRGRVLTNPAFRRQLVKFASENNLLRPL